MTRRKHLTQSQLSERRATRWSTAVMLVAMLGLLIAVLAPWGGLSWFALEAPHDPIAGWVSASSLAIWVFGALVLWSGVVWFWASHHRDGDRHAWVWSGRGLALVAAISLVSAYVGSRNGVALYPDRIVWRQAVLAPLTVTPDDAVVSLDASCQMVRRHRSVWPDDLTDRPFWRLSLTDGRTLEIGGVRGAGIGGLNQTRWLGAMRRLARYPVRIRSVDPRCVEIAVARFPEAEQAFVRGLFGT